MKEKWNFILYLLWFSYLIVSAVLMFGHGFLLSRKTLSDISECVPLNKFDCDGREIGNSTDIGICSEDERIRRILANPGSPMVCSPNRNRVMLVLVDALRYDFTEFDPQLQRPLPYQNRLPIIQETIDQHPHGSRLYRFVADPPTTTFQRIKALVTGSLPTFVDASSNFAAIELQEDNIVDQVVKNGGKVVLLGDDTWARLMPARWLRSNAMYSFHTWDLDTVDKGVDTKIYDELKREDWDLMVAHYLGVDHAGHRYGPNHPEMTRKLTECNNRLKKIIETLPPDVMLYVIGDHGMTENGDHGGESKLEKTAAFFAYRKGGFAGTLDEIGKEVKQTDFAPSISAALGRPPPMPSLGKVHLSVLPKITIPQSLLLLSNNLKQITKYLVRYGEESQQVSLDRLAEMINTTRDYIEKAAAVQNLDGLKKYDEDVRLMVDNIRDVFREVWVEFDSLSMMRALMLFILAIFFNWLITEGLPIDRIPHIFASTFVSCGYIAMAVCIAVCYTLYYFEVLENIEHSIYLSTGLVSGAVKCALVIMHWDGISQKWYEGRSPVYERFARAALVASAAVLISNSYIIEEGATLSFLCLSVLGLMAWNIATFKAIGVWVLLGVVLATSRLYRGCREEQGDCWIAARGEPTGQASRAALVLALGSVAAVVAVSRRHVGWRGYGVALSGLLACAHWAVGWGTLGSPGRSRLLARGSWLVLGAMFILLWKTDGRGANLPLIVCSLLFYVANTLVLGAAAAPSAALGLVTGILALYLVSMLKSEGTNKFSIATRCNTSVACLWALLASYQFYGVGHHATLGHVRWTPAFHAGDPNDLYLRTPVIGGLVFLDLFGLPLMFGAALPLLALWGRKGTSNVGPRTQLAAVFSLSLKFVLCFAIRVFVSALAATVHCRHLMIWGVFTPKLLFESGACLAALIGALLGITLTAWHLPTHHRSS